MAILPRRFQPAMRRAPLIFILLAGLLFNAGCAGSLSGPHPASPGDSVGLPSTDLDRAFILRLASGNQPLTVENHRELAELARICGDEPAALAHLWSAAELADDLSLWRELADSFEARGAWAFSRQALEAVLHLEPSDPGAHYALALMLAPYDVRRAFDHLSYALADPDLSEAALRLQNILAEFEPEPPAVQSMHLGSALAALGYWPQAEQAFASAAALDPYSGSAWAYLGLARARQGKDAASALDRAFTFAPDDPATNLLAGLVWRAAGDDGQSLAYLQHARELAPQNPTIAAELGTAYRLAGDFASAEVWLQRAVQLAPGEDAFLLSLAQFYAEESYNLAGGGLTFLHEAAARQPANADLLALYAWALYGQGQIEAAQEALTQARQLDPENPRVLYYQAVLDRSQSRNDSAVALSLHLLSHPAPRGFDVLARRMLEQMNYQP